MFRRNHNIINTQNVRCLFGYYKYTVPYKKYIDMLLCKNCMKFGYRKINGKDVRYELNTEGKIIHYRWEDEFEVPFNKKKVIG